MLPDPFKLLKAPSWISYLVAWIFLTCEPPSPCVTMTGPYNLPLAAV